MLPDLIARERAAAISQLLQELEDRSRSLAQASADIRMTLQAGTGTAQALQDTLTTLDTLAARYAALNPARNANTSEPFDVREYTVLLRETRETVRDLNVLAARIETMLPQTTDSMHRAAGDVSALMDRAFIQLIVLIVLVFACALITTLMYHNVTARRRNVVHPR